MALLAAFVIGGCGDEENGTGGQKPAASVNVSLGPIAQTRAVKFSEVPVGESQTKTVVVKNDTDIAQRIRRPTVSGGPFEITDSTCDEGTMLAPGASCTVDVTFTPRQAGESEAVLTVVPDKAGEMTAEMSGSAPGTTPTETTPTETTPTETTSSETTPPTAPDPQTSTTGG